MQRVDEGIQHVPIFGSLYNSQKSAMLADTGQGSGADALKDTALFGADLATTVFTGGATSGTGLKIVSRIDEVRGLSKAAEVAGTSVQNGLDSLVGQLAKGNLNPGIGTKKLFGEISYARARDGARVFFREVGDGIEILAKASKKNEDEVIRMLKNTYGK
ncbi:MAG: hypothetical protein WBD22_07430 [Pyrinomonadaceae bacterium]